MDSHDSSHSYSSRVAIFFERLNNAEPFIGIRILLVQTGLAFALYWYGGMEVQVPEGLDQLPVNLMGVFSEQSVIEFGYPMRELVWAGEWWRLLTGVLWPPGLGWFALSSLAFLPFARILERDMGRRAASALYLAGGGVTVVYDFFVSSNISAGGLGIVFAAGGAAAWNTLLNSRSDTADREKINLSAWMALALVGLLAWSLQFSSILFEWSPDFASMTQIGPSGGALAAAFVVGFCLAVPLVPRNPFTEPQPTLLTRLSWCVPVLGLAGVSTLCAWNWAQTSSVDYNIWRLDPLLRAANQHAQTELLELARQHPQDLFLGKRLALSHAAQKEWSAADEVLKTLTKLIRTSGPESALDRGYLLRRLRLARLNRRGPHELGPWRFSAVSQNYEVDTLRLLWDRAHLARMEGREEDLSTLREDLIRRFETTPILDAVVGDSNQAADKKRQALILNHNAYVRADLNGDLAKAVQEASAAVSLLPSCDIFDTFGWVEFRRGRIEEAITLLEKALLFDEPHSKGALHFHLGSAFHAEGKANEAREHFLAALDYDLDWWDELDLLEKCPSCFQP